MPHPIAALGGTFKRLPRYLVLARGLVGDRRLSRWRKAALGAGIAYLASPIDLVPGLIPVVGQLDDLAAVLLALRFALRGLPGAAAEARLADAGLTRAMLDEDVSAVRGAAGWVASRAASATGVAARKAVAVSGVAARKATSASGAAVRTSGTLAAAAGRLGARALRGAGKAVRERSRRERQAP